jgi:hypothetical protein
MRAIPFRYHSTGIPCDFGGENLMMCAGVEVKKKQVANRGGLFRLAQISGAVLLFG